MKIFEGRSLKWDRKEERGVPNFTFHTLVFKSCIFPLQVSFAIGGA